MPEDRVPNHPETVREYRQRIAVLESAVYAVGDRVAWIQKPKGDRPLATVVSVSPSGASVRVRFDEKQREFESIEVWLDKHAIEPEE